MIIPNLTIKDIERFWLKVNISDVPNACWEWQACTSHGYGVMNIRGRVILAHRLSYDLKYGEIPAKMFICHHCDNPRCVNPEHLFMGTQADNMKDKQNKGRATGSKGEECGRAKLTWDEVREIRKRYEYRSKDNNSVTLGKEFGVSHGVILLIIENRIWVE